MEKIFTLHFEVSGAMYVSNGMKVGYNEEAKPAEFKINDFVKKKTRSLYKYCVGLTEVIWKTKIFVAVKRRSRRLYLCQEVTFKNFRVISV
jgi:hypothetical protein